MTRVELAEERVRKEQAKREARERKIAETRFKDSLDERTSKLILAEERRNADKKRRYVWGTLAQDAGLFAWSHADITAVCRVLTRLAAVPEPVATLKAALGDKGQEGATGTRPADKVNNPKRYFFGATAQEAGLFVWTQAVFQGVVTVLAPLAQTPQPADVLGDLLDAHAAVFGEKPDDATAAKETLTRNGWAVPTTEVGR